MKLSTQAHGVMDYLTAGLLFFLPRLLDWGDAATTLFTVAAIAILGLSLMTRYELGLLKAIPMKVHLAMDALLGVALLVAPLFIAETTSALIAMLAIGLMEIVLAAITEKESTHAQLTA